MPHDQLAKSVREAVAQLNTALADAAQAGLAIQLRNTAHQSTSGVEQLVVEVKIFRQL